MKFMKNLIRPKNNSKYWFLFLIIAFALMSHLFFNTKKKNVIVFNRNKNMHWGFPMSKPPAPRMRNF